MILDFVFATPKRHILGRNRMFWRILRQNPHRALGCSELQEPPPKKKKTNTFLVRKFSHVQKRYACADGDERLHRCMGSRRNHLCRFVWLSLTAFGRGGGGVNFGLLHWLALSPLQHSRTTVRVCDKTSKVFCINICCFSTRFYFLLYHSGTAINISSKLWTFLISTPHKTRTFTVRLAVTTNTKETVLQQKCCLDATTQASSQSLLS